MSDTQAWRLSLIVELEADDLDAAGKIGDLRGGWTCHQEHRRGALAASRG
jgi:hypothetical protein